MKELIKKLNNFRRSAIFIAIGAFVGLVAIALMLALYQTSGSAIDAEGKAITTIAFKNNQIAGMFYFIFAIIAVIVGVTAFYKALLFIFPKTKKTPAKSIIWILFAENMLVLILNILVIFLLSTEKSNHTAGYVISLILGFLSVIYSVLWLYPLFHCHFFYPELKSNK